MARKASSGRSDLAHLREQVDGELDGFQIREVPDRGTAGLTPEQIALCDALLDAFRRLKGRDWEILLALKTNDYKVRETARSLDIRHFTIQQVLRKVMPGITG